MGILLLVTFWLFVLISPAEHNQYLAIFGFMILPGILMKGLFLCPVGIWPRKRKLKKHGEIKFVSTKKADFPGYHVLHGHADPGVAGYQGYHFTESAEFCGTVCHNMDPQYSGTTSRRTRGCDLPGCQSGRAPARSSKRNCRACARCFKTLKGDYPRPIPPAIMSFAARERAKCAIGPTVLSAQELKKSRTMPG